MIFLSLVQYATLKLYLSIEYFSGLKTSDISNLLDAADSDDDDEYEDMEDSDTEEHKKVWNFNFRICQHMFRPQSCSRRQENFNGQKADFIFDTECFYCRLHYRHQPNFGNRRVKSCRRRRNPKCPRPHLRRNWRVPTWASTPPKSQCTTELSTPGIPTITLLFFFSYHKHQDNRSFSRCPK